jgi:hypothetical protein
MLTKVVELPIFLTYTLSNGLAADPKFVAEFTGIIFPAMIFEAVDISVVPYTVKLPANEVCPATVADPVIDRLPLALISPLKYALPLTVNVPVLTEVLIPTLPVCPSNFI